MQTLNAAVLYLLSFKAFVLLPAIIFVLALVFGIKPRTAAQSALTLGIGFSGIFMTFDFYVWIINPVIKALVARTGLDFAVLDTGWIPLSVISWQYPLAPLLLVSFMATNALMLAVRKTRTVNIDVWNYWHVIFVSAAVHAATGKALIAVAFGLAAFALTLKISDWSAPSANRESGMRGICIPHLSGLTYYPIGVAGNALIDRVPGFAPYARTRKPSSGESATRRTYGDRILPRRGSRRRGGLPLQGDGRARGQLRRGHLYSSADVRDTRRGTGPDIGGHERIHTARFPDMGETFIGLDVAVLFGIPSVMVTPSPNPGIAVLAFVLPGVNFIPLGDLTNLTVPAAMICLATGGNIVRSFLIGIPVVIGNLYFASASPAVHPDGGSGELSSRGLRRDFTSYLDGGNLLADGSSIFRRVT
jgi:PTS system galactitol-specific IIC component